MAINTAYKPSPLSDVNLVVHVMLIPGAVSTATCLLYIPTLSHLRDRKDEETFEITTTLDIPRKCNTNPNQDILWLLETITRKPLQEKE
jgi:hypothetical protein